MIAASRGLAADASQRAIRAADRIRLTGSSAKISMSLCWYKFDAAASSVPTTIVDSRTALVCFKVLLRGYGEYEKEKSRT